jgi:hypothetical protein
MTQITSNITYQTQNVLRQSPLYFQSKLILLINNGKLQSKVCIIKLHHTHKPTVPLLILKEMKFLFDIR